ncbi:MAG: rRNA synthase [Halanaerobiales bacterium]|nr:rRNA synthase [Halanaerobiales bacterium]
MDKRVYKVKAEVAGKRLDKYLSEMDKELSRSFLQKLINEEKVLVNGGVTKSSYRIREGDRISLLIPEPREPDIEPVEIELDILYEDDDIIVVNKPAGLVVHPAPGNRDNTLVNALLAYTDRLSGINGVKRPGIIHRLDKDTSGALVVAKNDRSHQELVKQFKERKTKKIYHTIVKGKLPYEKGKIDAPIGRNPKQRKKMAVTEKNSKKAVTYFKVLEYFKDYTYLEVKLETGRTHQIRVHFSYLGHPVVGDEKYSRKKNEPGVKRQLLHAYKLGLFHPLSGEWMEFIAPLPDDFQKTLDYLRKKA